MKNGRSQKSEVRSQKPLRVTCHDCGGSYAAGAPHMMFCEAHTCEECGSSFSNVVEKNGEGQRVCDRCIEDQI